MINKEKVIIIGAGGHAAEIFEYISFKNENQTTYQIEVIGLLDDNQKNYSSYQYNAPLLGGIKEHIVRHDVKYIMGIANLKYRQKFVEEFLTQGAEFTSIIHPSAYISPTASLGSGVVIGPMANIGPNVIVGNYNLINSRCSIGHDTLLGDFNFVSPNVCFSGFTKIGNNNLFGINSATIPNINIGDNNKIAAGMILHNDVENNEIIFYRYKERIIARPKT